MAPRLGYPPPLDGISHRPGSVPLRQVCGASSADCVFHPDLALVASPASLFSFLFSEHKHNRDAFRHIGVVLVSDVIV